jgi:pimeloyl-ACP methyl ester carboxylesterase
MGTRLAHEVREFISDWGPAKRVTRISFIGHSMGGLIIRGALPMLEEF